MNVQAWIKLEEDVAMRVTNPGVSSLEEMRNRSGLEFLRDIASGVLPLPPIGKTLNFFLLEVEGRSGARRRQGHPPRQAGSHFGRSPVRAGREALCARHDDMRHLSDSRMRG